MINCIIIDDEFFSRERIKSFIRDYEELNILAEFSSANKALEHINDLKFDLVFLDIEMPGIKGIEFAKTLLEYPCKIIFITAYSDFALDSFEANTVDYLLKPISAETFARAIKKLELKQSTNIVLKIGNKEEILDIGKIVYFTSDNTYTKVISTEKEYLLNKSLDELEAEYQRFHFLRTHRSFLVNTKFFAELIRLADRKFEIQLRTKNFYRIKVSREKIDQVKLYFKSK